MPPAAVVRGRPRDASRNTAIADATLRLVAELGYDRVSMDAVAAAAHVSKATIYRRWPSKAALVAAAIRCRHQHDQDLVDTGDLRGDLLAGLRRMRGDLQDQDLDLMSGLLTAMRHDPELADELRRQVVDSKRAAARRWTDRCVQRGLLPADADLGLFHELAPAAVFFRLLLTGEPVDEAFLTQLVDDVLLPLLGRGPGKDLA